jgi:hypothetical protein
MDNVNCGVGSRLGRQAGQTGRVSRLALHYTGGKHYVRGKTIKTLINTVMVTMGSIGLMVKVSASCPGIIGLSPIPNMFLHMTPELV